MIVVSDTTPLSELAKVGQLVLLRDVSGRIIIPGEVYNELTAATDPTVTAVLLEKWVEVRQVIDTQKVITLRTTTKLGLGECGAITQAEELGATRLLLDDLAARKEAQRRGLPRTIIRLSAFIASVFAYVFVSSYQFMRGNDNCTNNITLLPQEIATILYLQNIDNVHQIVNTRFTTKQLP